MSRLTTLTLPLAAVLTGTAAAMMPITGEGDDD